MLENKIPKFRAWSSQYKMMFEVGGIYWFRDTYSITCDGVDDDFEFDEKEIELMQWSCFIDKNKKEIFEGDIVKLGGIDKFFVENFKGLYVLRWDERTDSGKGMFAFNLIHRDKMMHEYCANDFEVIGNIYENVDLLNAT